ncbi:MAG: STAS domain-containing protein [Sedimentisphaerales bacterium]|nr:STAS domain-containing protein [Sedimentisphaerales bacterium]
MQTGGPRIAVSQDGPITIAELMDEEILEENIIEDIAESLFGLVQEKPSLLLVLDFHQVKHLSSSALGTLIRLNKRIEETKGQLKLCGLRPTLYEIFTITKLNRLFNIYETRELAMKGI